ncbi:hypothetical protein [Promicromonospora sukumoe]
MTNIDRLKSDHARLVRDLEREQRKNKSLQQNVDRAEAKEREAFAAVKRAKPEQRAQAEAKQRAATAESDRVHAIYMNHANRDVKRAWDKVMAAFLRIKEAEGAYGTTVNNVSAPGAVVGIQARNITGGNYRF